MSRKKNTIYRENHSCPRMVNETEKDKFPSITENQKLRHSLMNKSLRMDL
jgi:hypothetical protein